MADTIYTTYDLPNYIGQLFLEDKIYPNRTLQLLGALSGAEDLGVQGFRRVQSTEFAVGQTYAIPDHKADTARTEGADAPDATGIARAQLDNVLQIWQEAVRVTYTKQAATQQLEGVNVGGESNPVVDELEFQTNAKLTQIIRNLNWTVINQTYQKPADNSTARKTRGFLAAVTSTRLDNAGVDRALTMDLLDEFAEAMVNNGGIMDGNSVVVAAGTRMLRVLNKLFRTDGLEPESRDVRGVRIRTVLTTFGQFSFYHEPDMPAGTLAALNFAVASLVAMPIPEKGVLFREQLARTGASEKYQIYGEIGLDHGPEWMHGVLEDLDESAV